MASPLTRAVVVMAHDLCAPGGELILQASLEARLIPVDFWTRFFSWLAVLRVNYTVGQQYVLAITAGIPGLDAGGRAELLEILENAIACAIDKPTRHVLAETPAADDAPAGNPAILVDRLRAELNIFKSRECFNIGQPSSMPAPGNDAAIWSWSVQATNTPAPSASFRAALNTFLEKKASNLLPAPVPPVPATPFSTADADALVHFWRAIAKDQELAPVGTAALRALSVAVSQTVVERQFSVLSNLEVDNRLHGSVRYVRNLLILRCNGLYFDQYVAGRAQVLGTAEL